jgi:hypothetical protein
MLRCRLFAVHEHLHWVYDVVAFALLAELISAADDQREQDAHDSRSLLLEVGTRAPSNETLLATWPLSSYPGHGARFITYSRVAYAFRARAGPRELSACGEWR